MPWLKQLSQWTLGVIRPLFRTHARRPGRRGRLRDRREAPHVEPLEDRCMLSLLGQPLFPADYPWNQNIANAPVAANSAAIISHIGTSIKIHPDWGDDNPANVGQPLYGIPFNVVHAKTTAKVNVIIDNYPDESDLVPVPIPAGAVIEGDYQSGPNPNGGGGNPGQRGDSHLLVWDEGTDTAYELYGVTRPSDPTLFPDTNGDELTHTDGRWHAAQETVWHMTEDQFRTLGATSADAAGLSILAGLARPDEGLPVSQGGQGAINHALRMTLPPGDVNPQYIYPASHIVNESQASNKLPFGARLRLESTPTIDALINAMPPESKIIAQAMQTYGLVLADIGSAMFVTGASASVDANNNIDQTWNMDNDILASNGLRTLTSGDFQVIDLTPIVTSLSATSGAAGSTITVNGQNFSGAAGKLSVLFGSTPSNSVTVLSDTQLSVVVPSGIGTVDVTVQSGVDETDNISSNPNANVNAPIFGYGVSATTTADRFTFVGGAEWTNGAGTLKWTDATNWSPSGVPGTSSDAFFAGAGLTSGATVNLNGSQTARSLAFQGTANFTLGGSGSLTLTTGALTRSPDAAGTQTISQPITLGANGAWNIAGSGELVVSSAVSGAFPLEKDGPGTLRLSGNNSYSGGTIVIAGTLVVANANSLPSGSRLTVGEFSGFHSAAMTPAGGADKGSVPIFAPTTSWRPPETGAAKMGLSLSPAWVLSRFLRPAKMSSPGWPPASAVDELAANRANGPSVAARDALLAEWSYV